MDRCGLSQDEAPAKIRSVREIYLSSGIEETLSWGRELSDVNPMPWT